MHEPDAAYRDSPPRGPGDLFLATGEVGADLARVDWAATPLGDPGRWPQSLTSAVGLVLRSRFSMWMAWGPQLTFFCNAAYRRDTLGAKYPWALGRPASEVWAEIWPDISPRIDRVLRTGEATWDEALLLFLERSGFPEETYHTFSYSPISDETGAVAGMLCVVTEDTERVVGARRLATLRDLGSETPGVDTPQGVLVSSARQLEANPQDLPFALLYSWDPRTATARLEAATGITPGSPAAPLTLPDGDEGAWPLAQVRSGRSLLVEDLTGRFDDLPTGRWAQPPLAAYLVTLPEQGRAQPAGFLIAGLNRYRPFDDGYRTFLEVVAGQVAARLATARAYEAERHRAEQLAELDRAKTAFFTNVSHEFRTPLTLLLGPAEDALNDARSPLPAPQRERVEVIQRNALRLMKLVNALLDFSRLESGRLQARFAPVDLARYTGELASTFASAIDRVGLTLTVDAPPLPEPVWIDEDLWAKVVLNLMSNALKFTFEGGITVRLRAVGDAAELTVSDTGIGIAPEEQDRLFERFYRATARRSRTHEGSGIGLALVAELAGLHGGSVGVTSTPGQGATFTVRIPRGRDHLPADALTPASEDPAGEHATATQLAEGFLAEAQRWLGGEAPSGAPDGAQAADGRPTGPAPDAPPASDAGQPPAARILVIDDNADMRDYLARLLADRYWVSTAADGRAGVEMARAHPPDLVLSDVMMPGLDGFGVLDALRADESTEHVPVVLLSARAGDEATVEGLEAGADDYLIKPFTSRELLARVRANLELDRVRRSRERLEQSQALLDQTQRLAGIGSWDIDLTTGGLTASAELLRQLRLSEEDLHDGRFARTLLSRTHPEDREALRAAVLRSATDGQPLDHEARVLDADGQARALHFLGEVIRDADGTPRRLRGSSQDVTAQRSAERAEAAAAASRQAAAREHQIADELQRSLVPAPAFTPDNLSIATYYRPGVEGTQVGGDWYDVIELGAGRTALVLGDVMGRGVHAAAVMGQLRAAIRAYARLDLPPDDVLELLDGVVRELGADQLVTCVYAVYDPGDCTLAYANAGHLPPLLLAPGQPVRRLLGASGPPLGIGPLLSGAEQIELDEGTLLVLYTDGLVERRGTDIDAGVSRLSELLDGPTEPLDLLPGRLVDELLPDGPDDDVAVLLALTREHAAPTRSDALRVASHERAVQEARGFVAATLARWEVDELATDDVILLVSELVTNAVVHGKPPIELRLRATPSDVVVQVFDGATYLPRQMRPTAEDEHGRGLQIVARLADRWGTRPTPGGKAIWCTVRRAPAAESTDGSEP